MTPHLKSTLWLCFVVGIALPSGPKLAAAADTFVPTAAEIKSTKSLIAGVMKDPESTQFRGLRGTFKAGEKHICGEVNAKNSMGGYVGFEQFYVVVHPPQSPMEIGEIVSDENRFMASDKVKDACQ